MATSADQELPRGSIPDEQMFRTLSERELAAVHESMPADANHRFAIFVEVLRVVDYWTVFQPLLSKERRLASTDFQILQWGWNRAAALLLSALPSVAVPMVESTTQTRSYAMTILHQLGRSVLMHRVADAVGAGFLKAERAGHGIVVRKTESKATTFADLLEFFRIEDLQRTINASGKFYKRWELFDLDEGAPPTRVGNFLGRRQIDFTRWKHSDVNSLMVPLIFPWESGRGTMMGYGAEPEIDDHFLAEAIENVVDWRSDAGLHPEVRVGDTTGAHAMAVAIILVSLHLKHIRFALLASKYHPRIVIPQSLTIWGPEGALAQSISEITDLDLVSVQRALDAVTMRPSEASFLHRQSTPFMPLLIGLGNGLVLRPVSSLARNPLLSITTLAERRDPRASDAFLKPREEWLRSEVYALFQGRRYECVEGTIRLRENGRLITDIDAAVFDGVTGDLALIQIKWQDYHTNDVRQLRSKARNLVKQIDEWAYRVAEWLSGKNAMAIAKSLRLNTKRNRPICAIYLFALSHSTARTEGYGFSAEHPSLAIANWPQFFRVRSEVGPAPRVFHEMHEALRRDASEVVAARPIPVDITVAGHSIRLEDFWFAVNTKGEKLGQE